MSYYTKIQWCHSTINPVMGCEGCELWPNLPRITQSLISLILRHSGNSDVSTVKREIENMLRDYPHATAVWHERFKLARRLNQRFLSVESYEVQKSIEEKFKCYAGIQHMARGAEPTDWGAPANKGYAPVFDMPKRFPGRMKAAAAWPDLTDSKDKTKPWLDDSPRLIFVSDMGDALSSQIENEYLKAEIIDNVISTKGRRHIWLWLTKRPDRMAEFASWLLNEHGQHWPDNLVPMTTVTNRATRSRIDSLCKIPAKVRGLSVEPLFEQVDLDLSGIDWVIVGGESGVRPSIFDLSWARSIQNQCQEAGAAFFMKQLGGEIRDDGYPIKVKDSHGGDWLEWPVDLRVRELPPAFKDGSLVTSPTDQSNQVASDCAAQ